MSPPTLLQLASNRVGRDIYIAVRDNDIQRLRYLLGYRDLALVGGVGVLLFIAAEKGFWEVFTFLLDKGAGSAVNWWANITLEYKAGRYSISSRVGGGHLLALACSRGNVAAVNRILTEATAAGETIGGLNKALHHATSYEIARVLQNAGAVPDFFADRRVILQPGFELFGLKEIGRQRATI